MIIKSRLFLTLLCICFLASCSNVAKDNLESSTKENQEYTPDNNLVRIHILEIQPFKSELLSNGKLVANQKSLLKFRVSGSLDELHVDNGQQVRKGQILAVLNPFEYEQALTSADIAYKKAQLEFEDMLVGRGYELSQRDSIPDQIFEMASLRSGYSEANNQLENARFDVSATKLHAPFAGKVANLEYKQYEQVNAGTEVLTLIDDAVFEVEFYLLESEADQIKVGENVEVLTFNSEQTYAGKISAINPVVEKNGMLQVKAEIKNDGKLIEGMNVKVIIQKEVPEKLVVPKSTIILRDNQEVLFKYQNGKAFWTYVQTTEENSNSYSVIAHPDKSSASLQEGDTVIVTGNLNLAHESDVEITVD